MRGAAIAVASLVALWPVVGAFAGACQKNFEPVQKTSESVYADAAPAILKIKCGTEIGTGYLMDAAQGFVLTAFHVVKLHGTNPITATIQGRRGELTLAFVDTLYHESPRVDLALLRVDPLPADIQTLPPLELVDITPKPGRTVYTTGYPQLKKADGTLDPKRDLIPVDGQYERAEDDGTLRIRGLRRPADSGSPLLDQYGRVLGTCVNSFLPPSAPEEAFYVPTWQALRLLHHIPVSPRMAALDTQIRSGVDAETLAGLLVRTDGSCCTNIELLLWSRQVANARDALKKEYAARAELLDCPLSVACSHRQMWEAASNLRTYLKPAAGGRLALRTADELASRPGVDQAQVTALYSEARTLLGRALLDRAGAEPSGLERVACRAGTETVAAIRAADPFLADVFATVDTTNTKCAIADSDTPTYYLLHDYTLATLKFREKDTKRADAVAAAAATYFAASNNDQEALSLATVGEALAESGEHFAAATAYARAYRLGNKEPWIRENWSFSATAAAAQDRSLKRLFSRGIAFSPNIDSAAVRSLVGEF